MTALRVAINAQLRPDGAAGGIEQFVASLVRSLGELDDGPETYTVVGPARDPDWLEPLLGPNQRLVAAPEPRGVGGLLKRARDSGRHRLSAHVDAAGVESSRGFFEGLGDVVHFPFQAYRRCTLPTVFNPHDLQHEHHPELVPPGRLDHRRTTSRAACRLADAVAAESRQTAEDVVRSYGVDRSKVHVIYRGAPTALEPQPSAAAVEAVRRELGVSVFALYPAQTWPHKNHVRLARALGLLRERRGIVLTVVCTGRQNDFFPEIEAEARRAGVGEQLRFLGFVEATELRALYRLAQFVVLPSLFEGGGFPLVEAFDEGAPVACSDVPAYVEYAGDAALLFDPLSEESIADVLARMVGDEVLREDLARRGRERVARFTWPRTAATYRALYRRLAGVALSAADRELLSEAAFRLTPA